MLQVYTLELKLKWNQGRPDLHFAVEVGEVRVEVANFSQAVASKLQRVGVFSQPILPATPSAICFFGDNSNNNKSVTPESSFDCELTETSYGYVLDQNGTAPTA